MQPGALTGTGMLGTDRRQFAEIIESDHTEVQRLGLTHEKIAARMRELRDAGAKGFGFEIIVQDHFAVRVDSVRGRLSCPFQHKGSYRKEYTEVRNLKNGIQVLYSDLNIHMIEAHGFYEGRGAEFRQDPAKLAHALEIV